MKSFIKEDFLLESNFAAALYEKHAKNLPIIDFHCHLPVEDIAEDRQFQTITEIWINGDHYKWRAMRALGIAEEYITGNRSDAEKFQKWAETIPYTMRNPLYHWTHLELELYFGITDLLNGRNAGKIFQQCNDLLATPAFSARNLLKKMKVEVVCTSDDPVDDLRFHEQLKNEHFEVKILPTFRPDVLLNIDQPGFLDYLQKLAKISGVEIKNFASLLRAIQQRVDFFHEMGCRLSDHGLDYAPSEEFTEAQLDEILQKSLENTAVSEEEAKCYRSALMYYLGKMYAEKNWVMQLHLGPIRNNSTRLKEKLGANAGVDSIGDFQQAKSLSGYLDKLDRENRLPKTILYNVNPADNEVMATMTGNFMGDTPKGKIQHGAAWWFLDQKNGIERQLDAISNMGLLSCFVGMLTDSRSLLSYPRHEYFRRVLCNLFGRDVVNSELPEDMEWIGKIVEDVCYYNAKEYFNFPD
ncbi:MAG: glucuronate isomerase [Christiangramia sp.]|uniref:glucuronate isomerase n=1 Tax=Christiangramia sp. TaxID=1931228 RepID=UPI003241BCC4